MLSTTVYAIIEPKYDNYGKINGLNVAGMLKSPPTDGRMAVQVTLRVPEFLFGPYPVTFSLEEPTVQGKAHLVKDSGHEI